MKILLPNQNFSQDMNFKITSETTDYEIKRAFSPDSYEHAKVDTNDFVYMDFSSINSGTPSLLIWNRDNTLVTNPILVSDIDDNFNTPTTLNISVSYGDGYLRLFEYSNNPGELFLRLYLQNTITEEIRAIVYGRIYNLPDGRLEDRSQSFKYFKSKVTVGLSGIINYSGLQTSLRKKNKIKFEFLDLNDKDILETIFLASKGFLPVWFIEDETDPDTWIQVIMNTFNIKEPFAGYFTVEISMEEL